MLVETVEKEGGLFLFRGTDRMERQHRPELANYQLQAQKKTDNVIFGERL